MTNNRVSIHAISRPFHLAKLLFHRAEHNYNFNDKKLMNLMSVVSSHKSTCKCEQGWVMYMCMYKAWKLHRNSEKEIRFRYVKSSSFCSLHFRKCTHHYYLFLFFASHLKLTFN